ncbi:MAG: nucleotidyltransferase family protein [Candidatus Schekmanbacteria bacterium]|nr:nucleotidyltransferase family protein [Candidatus Schekmanbacteria bacterium]
MKKVEKMYNENHDKSEAVRRFVYLLSSQITSDKIKKEEAYLLDCLPEEDTLADCLIKHKMAPLVLKNIKDSRLEGKVNGKVYDLIKDLAYRLAAKNIMSIERFRSIASSLKNTGIDFIPLKGLSLCSRVYKDDGLRPMDDIDILIKEEDLQKTKDILFTCGLEPERTEYQSVIHAALEAYSSKEWIESAGERTDEVHFRDFNNGFMIDLHWNLMVIGSSRQFDMKKIWSRGVEGNVSGIPCRFLSPEDELLHLIFHLIEKHLVKGNAGVRLIWFVDIVHFLTVFQDKLDWSYIEREIELFKPDKEFYRVINFLYRNYHVFFPDKIISHKDSSMTEITPDDIMASFIESIIESMTSGQSKNDNTGGSHLFPQINELKGFQNKIKYIFYTLFPVPAYMRARYGSNRGFSLLKSYIKRLKLI